MKKLNYVLQIVFIGFFTVQTINLFAQKNSNIKPIWQTKVKVQKFFYLSIILFILPLFAKSLTLTINESNALCN